MRTELKPAELFSHSDGSYNSQEQEETRKTTKPEALKMR